jgi:tRNA pseudouridine32 synthase / 23S rRNA pseudouridine746 synthase
VAPLTVLYEDDWVVAIDKPEGLLSVPGRTPELEDSALSRLQARFPGARLVHRLDLDTSGVLVAAKSPQMHRVLQHQFAARTVEKRYLALVEGDVPQAQGEIDLPLRVDLNDRPRQLHDPVHGRAAVTAYRVLERLGGRTRLELTPRTGRTHQLRVHTALGLSAPIVGDRLYGTRGPRLMLHAAEIAFRHPHTGAPVRIISPAPF